MRIAIDGLLLWGRYSGVERTIARLAEALPQVDPDNEYVLYGPSDLPGGLPARRAPFAGRRKLVRILWQQLLFPRVLHADGIDALFAPGYVMPLRRRGPTVLLVHDVIALTHPELARRANAWHYRLVLPPSARRATRIVVPSAHVRGQVVEHCGVPVENVAVVPWGVDPCFRPVEDEVGLAPVRKRYALPERFVLYVGNLEPKKNLGRVLEAFASVRRAGLPQHLVLAGKEGWGMRPLPEALAGLGIADCVHCTGFLPDEDLPALYSLADAFVFPSLVEGFGLPPLEAMACGTPAVVADAPPFPETVGDAALRVDPMDPEAIAAGLRRVIEDAGLRASLLEAGRARAAQFTWQRAAQSVAALLKEAASVQ